MGRIPCFKRPISKACKKILCFVFLSVYPAEEQKPTAINVLQIYHIPERTDGTVFTRNCFVTFLGNREEEQKTEEERRWFSSCIEAQYLEHQWLREGAASLGPDATSPAIGKDIIGGGGVRHAVRTVPGTVVPLGLHRLSPRTWRVLACPISSWEDRACTIEEGARLVSWWSLYSTKRKKCS